MDHLPVNINNHASSLNFNKTDASYLLTPISYKKLHGCIKSKPSFNANIITILVAITFDNSNLFFSILDTFKYYLNFSKCNKLLQLTFCLDVKIIESELFETIKNTIFSLEKKYFFKLYINYNVNLISEEKINKLSEADLFVNLNSNIQAIEFILNARASGCRIVSINNACNKYYAGSDSHLVDAENPASLAHELMAAIMLISAPNWSDGKDSGYSTFVSRNITDLGKFTPIKTNKQLLSLLDRVPSVGSIKNYKEITSNGSTYQLTLIEEPQIKRPIGINAIGFFSVTLGLGESARAIIYGLMSQKILPYALTDFRLSHQSLNRANTLFDVYDSDFKFSFNLSMVNSPELPYLMDKYGVNNFKGRYNIGLWYWELVDINQEWHASFQLIDELWVTSEYIYNNVIQCSPIPVHKIILPIVIDTDKVTPSRENFKLPLNIFLYIFAFDHNSLIARKNPFAVIDAFRMAFGARKDVGIVIKTLNGINHPLSERVLRDACIDLNVFFIDEDLDRYETLSLYATCNSFVSLHRAEGFGMSIAEAMLLGKAVIATGYSGNMEFMNHQNSLPVRYKLVQITEDHGPYKKDQWWAEPDIIHASQCMLALYEDSILCSQIGENAKTHISMHFSAEKSGQSINERISNIIKENYVSNQFYTTE